MDKFSDWLKLQEIIDAGPIPDYVPPERQWQNVRGGLGDKKMLNNPMRNKSTPTSAFPTYGGEPLPGNKRAMKR